MCVLCCRASLMSLGAYMYLCWNSSKERIVVVISLKI